MSEGAPTTSVQYLPGIGPARAAALARMGIVAPADLLRHVPRAYEDRRTVHPIAAVPAGTAAIAGEVTAVDFRRVRPNLTILRATLRDATGEAACLWYNRAYARRDVVRGARLVVWGDVERDLFGRRVEVNVREWAGEDRRADIAGRIFPVYPLTAGLTQRAIRKAAAAAIRAAAWPPGDALADDLARARALPALAAAYRSIHFPRDPAEVEPARRRLALEEVLAVARTLVRRRRARPAGRPRPPAVNAAAAERLRAGLPWPLTPGQAAAWAEILAEIRGPRPMRRLVQADVGAGKTVVAILAVAAVAAAGRQAALMAPTEVLAEQHYSNWAATLERLGLRTVLLSAAHRAERPAAVEDLSSGQASIAIGTHALLEPDVRFRDLGLAVVDEEQRFGVAQRESLAAKGEGVDLLLLSATPIPRTLALTLYADLDVTTIPDLPPGRKGIETIRLRRSERKAILPRLRRTLEAGLQALFVYPLVEESAEKDLKAATTQAERIARAFPGVEVGCLTGRLPGEDREGVARAFREGRIRILVATTVVEVGIDVPGAALVVIEHAERFGLAQLHQIRGRVGRGGEAGTCLVTTAERLGEEAEARIEAFLATTDGFALAERDLEIRGPGEIAGLRQSGAADLRIARLPRDADLLRAALEAVEKGT